MQETIGSDLSIGIVATRDDEKPLGLRVNWIAWNSGFRDSGLTIGDRVVAVDGVALDPAGPDLKYTQHVGAAGEWSRWNRLGGRDGQEVVLTVERQGARRDVRGTLRAARSWRSDDNRPLLSPDGPDRLSSDGQIGGWGGWYEKLVERLSITLDGTWRHRIDSRARLADLLAEKPRVDLLISRWPGPFADTLAADFAAAADCLDGRVYHVRDEELAYRQLGPDRAAEIQLAARSARAAFLAAHAPDLIAPFPTAEAMSVSARERVVGRWVDLPTFRRGSQWEEGRRHWFVAGDDREGFYFVDANSDAMERAFQADWRYMKLIDPRAKYEYTIVGRIAAAPKMIVHDGRAYTGLVVEPMGVTVGDDALFVDLTEESGRYAGEPSAPDRIDLPPDLSPEALMASLIRAIKQADQKSWAACYATWEVTVHDQGRVSYSAQSPVYGPNQEREWVKAREQILGPVYDMRVVGADPPRVLLTPDAFAGAPLIEQVEVEVDHVGLFGGVYRAFCNMHTTHIWPLQRRDGGPWRIASDRGI